jgi:hypothetical protein
MKTIKISLQGLALKNQRHACLPKTIKFYYFNNLKKYDTAFEQQNVVKDNSTSSFSKNLSLFFRL